MHRKMTRADRADLAAWLALPHNVCCNQAKVVRLVRGEAIHDDHVRIDLHRLEAGPVCLCTAPELERQARRASAVDDG